MELLTFHTSLHVDWTRQTFASNPTEDVKCYELLLCTVTTKGMRTSGVG
jgi:hypothetical protein